MHYTLARGPRHVPHSPVSRWTRRLGILAIALSPLAGLATPVAASSPIHFQHGGRATGQAGAFVARADQPVALAYNPAAITRLPGFQGQAGADFTAPREDYISATGRHSSNHIITHVPAVYMTWALPEDRYPFAFGLGLDTKSWYYVEFHTALFPGRFLTRLQELTLFDLRPVVAYQLDERWSVGASLHYYYGTLGEGTNRFLNVLGTTDLHRIEVERLAEATVDSFAVDLGFHYAGPGWGWGLVMDTGSRLTGTGRVTYSPRDVPDDPLVQSRLEQQLGPARSEQGFDLPWELRTGFWLALTPELKMELDAVYLGWSRVRRTSVTYRPDPFSNSPSRAETRERGWNDTVSLRLGVEGAVGPKWLLYGGLGWEPTPVPEETLEPGFPRDDAWVYAVGFSYRYRTTSIDVGYSFHDHRNREARGQEAQSPGVESTYKARNQVWAFSLSWRW
jgi:long-chain fatty acid transport protein